MRIVCVGGGPAGLYTAVAAKLRSPDLDVTVVERNARGATYGWGVVFWDDLLDTLHGVDPVSGRALRRAARLWEGQEVRLPGGRVAHLGGYGFSIGRGRMLEILTDRAAELGVDLRFGTDVADGPAVGELLDGADVVVAADGVHSGWRERDRDVHGTQVREGRNRYIWLGTRRVFDAFTFGFELTPAGWIWFHAYPSDAATSTFIVECPPLTWNGLGFDVLAPAACTEELSRIFATYLRGETLLDTTGGSAASSRWLRFRHITNKRWVSGNRVLVGDAAHTTHFSVGAGTKLALEDAAELAAQLVAHRSDVPAALTAYDEHRRRALRPRQAAAQASMEWFERLDPPADVDVVDFAYALWTRRGRYPAWRYRLHRATQNGQFRRVRQEVSAARRVLRAHRRERGVAPSGRPGNVGIEPADEHGAGIR
jgi:2-polyprenyl-6-methoxyphenol hydroxylase-like FAD-dependent oxidoreductase